MAYLFTSRKFDWLSKRAGISNAKKSQAHVKKRFALLYKRNQRSLTTSMTSSKFYYFAYGSNLLAQRLHLNIPTAKFIGVGRLTNYHLTFNSHEKISSWGPGCAVASIEPHHSDIFGAIWCISEEDRPKLDKQEGVPLLYRPLMVKIYHLSENSPLECRSYAMNDRSPGLPSPYYLDVILRGAIQSGLPPDYLKKLRQIKHADYLDECHVYEKCLNLLPLEERFEFQVSVLKKLYLPQC